MHESLQAGQLSYQVTQDNSLIMRNALVQAVLPPLIQLLSYRNKLNQGDKCATFAYHIGEAEYVLSKNENEFTRYKV